MSGLVACAAAIATTVLALYWLIRLAPRLGFVDHPNSRSMHIKATPRCGGLAIVSGVVAGALIWGPAGMLADPMTIAGGLSLVLISAWDDRGHVSPMLRLAVQIGAVAPLLVAHYGSVLYVLPGTALVFAGPVLLFVAVWSMVWLINLYNFMDGLDGFAGGMAVVGFSALAIIGWDIPGFGATGTLIAVSAAVFLVFNFPPAKVFLGDAGSASLGWAVAAMGIWGAAAGAVPIWASILVFSPFIMDASVTLARRMLHGCRPWQAHRDHLYQRLVRSGISRVVVVGTGYLLMLCCALSAYWMRDMQPAAQWAGLMVWAGLYAILIAIAWHYTGKRMVA